MENILQIPMAKRVCPQLHNIILHCQLYHEPCTKSVLLNQFLGCHETEISNKLFLALNPQITFKCANFLTTACWICKNLMDNDFKL